ncbi:hypothetical protein EJ02DRAFT_453587 [Clathrospora elynae]|uniref:Uncharacterized protein n=1 Tax=Clathrospora elynae TaxID=706981 RepID=A0A6A5SRK9_9PLEO|nr:hypothetical protein EJ02DRAFT_453587 [Clathrospora elynae]
MSLVTLPSLPDPILHLICIYLTPDRPTVNDEENGQSPTLYRPIISLSLTAHSLNRISSTHIATNISLTDCCVRWDLFLRTVTTNATYAANVKYLKLYEGTVQGWESKRPTTYDSPDDICKLFMALSGLEALYLHHGESLCAGDIIHRLTCEPRPLWKTLEVARFDHVNVWGEERIVQLHLVREGGKVKGTWPIKENKPGCASSWGNETLTGVIKNLDTGALGRLPGVDHVEVTTRDYEERGDDQKDGDWVDEDEEEEEEADSDGWSERDYEEDSGESDWDSEDDSDYEDDWEAESGFSLPKVGPIKDVPTLSSPVPATIGMLKF